MLRRGAGVAERTGFENQRIARCRGFESLPLRHFHAQLHRSEGLPMPLTRGYTLSPLLAAERWQSGRMRQLAKLLSPFGGSEGSNPSLSATSSTPKVSRACP